MENVSVKMMSCGGEFSVILTYQGDLYTFGSKYNSIKLLFLIIFIFFNNFLEENKKGELGIGSTENSYEPILLMNDNAIKYITCGDSHCFILKHNGDVLGFGSKNSFFLLTNF